VKQWLETRQVLDRLASLASAGQRAALATVIRVRGSAYRHEGAKLLVAADGRTAGNVSGGCLEADVRELALDVIRDGQPLRRAWCGSIDPIEAWDLGVGCEGEVELLLEPVDAPRPGERALLDQEAPFVVITRLDGAAPLPRLVLGRCVASGTLGATAIDAVAQASSAAWLAEGRSGLRTVAGVPCFVEVFVPPPRLVILGAGDDAAVLANLADDIGFRVHVVDRRPALLAAERFRSGVRRHEGDVETLRATVPLDLQSYAVVMHHHFADDLAALGALMATDVPYIGMLGPRQRTERMLVTLGAGIESALSRVYGPVGLDIGTDGAEQVALSVVAEVLAIRSGRGAVSLRERRAPIHAALAEVGGG
jgi:xanthine/CO dehydrogenase XdhC/CoxF family maturation factor